jgi:hypothetical protein
MDIRVTSSGRIFYRVDDCTAALLIEALPSVFERAKPPAPPAPQTTPRFYVAPSQHTGNIGLWVQLPTGEVRSTYNAANKAAAESALGVKADAIPQPVWDAFDAKKKAQNPSEALMDVAARQVAGNRW